jgi:hypothetical protein
MKIPLIVSPLLGTVFNKNPVIGGKIRIPSLMTACRYSSLRASASVIGFEICEVEISDSNFERTWGLVTI